MRELGAHHAAFAHHLDDNIENWLLWRRVMRSCSPLAHGYGDASDMTAIRPLLRHHKVRTEVAPEVAPGFGSTLMRSSSA